MSPQRVVLPRKNDTDLCAAKVLLFAHMGHFILF